METKIESEIKDKIRIGITHGDINGVGYEVILKSLKDPRIFDFFTPIIYGSPKVAAYYKKVLKYFKMNLNNVRFAEKANPKAINILNCASNKVRVELGKSTKDAGVAAVNALRHAVVDLKTNKLDAIVTAPINKENCQSESFSFPGHTEFLSTELDTPEVVMLMIYEKLRIGVVTGHIPINKVSETITKEKILTKLRIIDKSLKYDFAINKPVIAVLSLNPHAGDNGLIGNEDKDIILPAILKAKEEGIVAVGPYPADGFFGSDNYKKFDAVLAMYHDQGLIPFKALARSCGVNYTAGLPYIRTSPAHGTAYDIAGQNIAEHKSFQEALYLTREIFKNRRMLEELDIPQKEPVKEKHAQLKNIIESVNEIENE